MHGATSSSSRTRTGRLLLVALFLGLAWTILSLFVSASSASAHGDNEHGSGILGLVGQTVDAAGSVVSATTGAADDVVAGVATATTPVVQPVVEPLPAHVAQPIAGVLTAIGEAADTAVASIDAAVVAVVETTTSTASDVAGAEVVTTVVTPAVELAESVPLAGDAVEGIGLGEALTDVAGGVDDTLTTVVGSTPAVGSVLPDLPLTGVEDIVTIIGGGNSTNPSTPGTPPGLPPLAATPLVPAGSGSLRGLDPDASTSDTVSPPSSGGWARWSALRAGGGSHEAFSGHGVAPAAVELPSEGPSGGLPVGSTLAGGPASATTGGSSSTTAGLAYEGTDSLLYAYSTLRTTTDDALPGAPVFDTDVAPD